jgi:branched-subunit amino acid aminotransferase/4-amino-4-deoxychorismate lyase
MCIEKAGRGVIPRPRLQFGCVQASRRLKIGGPKNADAIFFSGNYSKVMPINRIDTRSLQPGPLYRKARELYWAFAHG